jgi:hypothetical protein
VTIIAEPRTEPPDDPEQVGPDGTGSGRPDRSFLRWGVATYLVTVALAVAGTLWWLGGTYVYVLDDPAIHLSVAERLAHHGTWGVVPGHFESASSSPLWTLLVSAGVLVAGPFDEWVPLVLNVAAGVAAVAVLAAGQSVVAPGRRRPVDAVTTAVLIVVVLFLPGLAVVGMEHTLQVALVLAAVLGAHRWALERPGPGPAVTYAVLVAAALVRFETAFVAAGLAVALVLVDRRAHWRRALGVLAAAGVPIVAFAVVNRALGGGWLPNSILAKGQGTGQDQGDGLGPIDIAGRLTHDPMLAALVALAVVYLLLRGRRSPAFLPATTLIVATGLHAVLADVGWYDRYQAYLIAVGAYMVLGILAEVPAAVRPRAVLAVGVVGLLLGVTKVGLITRAPLAADDMYRQQYHAGQFLDSYYDGQPVATDQLGYISYFHDGPLTDLAGLGDYGVLQTPGHPSAETWGRLADERGFRVVVVYDLSFRNIPPDWILAGSWEIPGKPLAGVTDTLQFFATEPEEVAPLQQHLRDYEDRMPDRSELIINPGAGLQAMVVAEQATDQGDE